MRRLVTLLCLFCLFLSSQAFAYSVSLVPSFQSIQTGQDAKVDVNLSVAPGEQLFGFDLALLFDPSILQFNALQFGKQLKYDYVTGFDAPSVASPDRVAFNGALGFDALSGISSDVTLATLHFNGLGAGISPLDLSGSVLDMDLAADLVAVADSGSIQVNSSTPAPVPEPATCLLLGSGLAGLLGFGRRLRKA